MVQTILRLRAAVDHAHARGLAWCTRKREWEIPTMGNTSSFDWEKFLRGDYSHALVACGMWQGLWMLVLTLDVC